MTRVDPAARYSSFDIFVVEVERVTRRVGLVEREAHRDAHPEVLRHLERVVVARLDAVAVVERDDADVLEQAVAARLERGGEALEVVEVEEARVEQRLGDAALDRGAEVLGVQRLELGVGLVVAEHALVDGLQQEAGGDGVELGVVLDVLQRDLDDRLIQLLGGDAVEQGQLELGRDLGDPGDVLVEALAGVLDREIDLVGVVGLALSVALDDRDAHSTLSSFTSLHAENTRSLVARRASEIGQSASPSWPRGFITIYRGTDTGGNHNM